MSDMYEVETILEKQIKDGVQKCLVKWKDYEDPTWEPIENFLQFDFIKKDTNGHQSDDKNDQKKKQLIQINSKKIHKHKIEEIKIQKKEKEVPGSGSFESDQAQEIIRCQRNKEDLNFEVQWRPKKDGYQPLNTIYSNKACRKMIPQLVIDYYQGRVFFKNEFLN